MVTCTGHIGIHEGADGRTDVPTDVRTYVRTLRSSATNMYQDSCTPNSTDLGNGNHLLRSSYNLLTQWPNRSMMVSTLM